MKRMFLIGCACTTACLAVACGGSSSETPFPQAPIEPGLEQRHEAVFDAEFAAEAAPVSAAAPSSVSRDTAGSAAATGGATTNPAPTATAAAASKPTDAAAGSPATVEPMGSGTDSAPTKTDSTK